MDGQYQLILKASEGRIRSFALPGFDIPIQAAFDEDINLELMASILQSQPPA